jgi:hypothetical protein
MLPPMTRVTEGELTTPALRFEAMRDIQLIEIKDGLVVYQQEPQRIHRLNRTAAVIYLLCDGSRVVEEIADEVQLVFNTENRPHHAVINCLRQLTEMGLIRPVDGETDVVDNRLATTTSPFGDASESTQADD